MGSKPGETYKVWSTEQLERAFGQDRDLYDPDAVQVMAEELRRRRLSDTWMCLNCGVLNPAGVTTCACESDPVAEPLPLSNASTKANRHAADGRTCPSCGRIIDKEECRACRQVLIESRAARLVVGATRQEYVEGSLFGAALSPESVLQIIDEIKRLANRGIWFSIVGFGILLIALMLTGGRIPPLPFFIPLVLAPLGIYFSGKAISELAEHPQCEGLTSARGTARAGQILGWMLVGLCALMIINTLRRS
jgi:hypothetical protein